MLFTLGRLPHANLAPMIRRTLYCLSSLGLVACATSLNSTSPAVQEAAVPAVTAQGTTALPPETAVEKITAPTVVEAPVDFATARAAFIRDTAKRYKLDPKKIEATLDQAKFLDSVVAAMSRPAERVKPWHEYQQGFITQSRIDGGRAFQARHRDALAKVEREYGVPAEMITSIIGVETNYGGFTGRHKVLDALYTLAFRYPRSGNPERAAYEQRREQFFRDELAQLFALAEEEKLDIASLTGSYAGAMGLGQFMPSSYREFAVDGDGDGRRDLFNSHADVFASIANYFRKKGGARGGWVPGGAVVAQAVKDAGRDEFKPETWTPDYTLADLAARGFRPSGSVPADATATLVTLTGSAGPQYWLGFQNFYAITRYNNSLMYAMAVHQLAEAIAGREVPPA